MAKRTSGVAGLMSAAKKKGSASKSTTPTVAVADELRGALHDLCEASRDMKLAESRRKDAASQLLKWSNDERNRRSIASGQAISSLKIFSAQDNATFTTQTRCKMMKVEDGADARLQSAFGDDYDKYFSIAPQIKISDDITEEQASKLTAALQKAGLMDLVEVNPVVVPNARFYQDMVLDPKIAAIAGQVQDDGLCKPIQMFKV